MDWYEGFKKDCPSGKLDVNEFKEIKHLISNRVAGRKFTFKEHYRSYFCLFKESVFRHFLICLSSVNDFVRLCMATFFPLEMHPSSRCTFLEHLTPMVMGQSTLKSSSRLSGELTGYTCPQTITGFPHSASPREGKSTRSCAGLSACTI